MKNIQINLADELIVVQLVQKTSHGITRVQLYTPMKEQIGVASDKVTRLINVKAELGKRRIYIDPLHEMKRQCETGRFRRQL